MKSVSGGGAAVSLLLLLIGRCCCTSPDRRVCQGMSNQLTQLGTRDNHYDNMVRMYSNCSVVLENLEVTYTMEHQDLSFLQSIQEVGGYVLIAMNEVTTVPLVNLRLIRGQNLYEGRFALLVISNYHKNQSSPTLNYTSGLRQLQLSRLTEILRGGVKITHNPLLCNTETIQWWDIVDKSSNHSMLLNLEPPQRCEKCDPGCFNGSCWAAGPDHCQKFTKLRCAEQCSQRCRGPKPIDCCHEQCAAGCTGPRATDCLACRAFNDDGTCKAECPALKVYDLKTHQMINNPNGKFTFGATCVKACPHNYVVTEGWCVRTCKAGKFEVEENGVQRCKDCDGPCPKACDGVGFGSLVKTMAVNASNIESFRNCTKINGDISLIMTSFNGDKHYGIPPMDPRKLEYFRTVKEITGFLLIQFLPENVTSLSVFENLEIIRGRTIHQSRYSLVVMRAQQLRWLGLRSLREVSAGRVLLRDNPRLCFIQPQQWTRLFRSNQQNISIHNICPADVCKQQNLTCHEECTDAGCWGPDPNMCVSCRHFERRGRCVTSCNLLHGEPREFAVKSSCVACHQECRPTSGTPSCSGPGPAQCTQCAHFKDGPHCVSRCPHGVQGDRGTLIWKYPDGSDECQSCHQNCTEGCSGPGLSGCSRPPPHSTLAAAVVGGLLVVIIVSLIVFVLLRRRRIKRKRTLRRILQERELVQPLTPSGEAPNKALLRILKETELTKSKELGSGTFGTVYKGLWIPEGEGVKVPVAIKVLREATSTKASQEILDEAYVMASVDHPHVCRLLGICLTSTVQLVMQLMPFGCLLEYVRLHKNNIGAQWLLSWCVQIAKGMSYLEGRHLVHRDLAARNVLMKSPHHVAITDFGLAKLLAADEKEYHVTGGKVPIKWMALESILQRTCTHQSDVWSYGVTVWEVMMFGAKPYDGISAFDIVPLLEKGERLPQPPICTAEVYMVMSKCWMIDPSHRPRFRELEATFSQMTKDPYRFLVIQGDLPSPSDHRFYSRLLSSDDTEDVVDAEEYLRPHKGRGNRGNHSCNATNHRPVRENSIALRYITDPTFNAMEKDFTGHEYVNQSTSEARGSSRLSEVQNPNYEDLSLDCGATSLLKPSSQVPVGPEYLNTPQNVFQFPLLASNSLDNPDYQADFLPRTTTTTASLSNDNVFLLAAENLEDLSAALHVPVR